jgi:4-hydroxythreonine-4-phosphate dehydrogenase
VTLAAEAPLVVTQGDPAGIGPEITLQAWLRRRQADLPPFAVIADPGHLDSLARALGWPVPCEVIGVANEAAAVFDRALPILPLPQATRATPGVSDRAHAPGTLASIETAVALALRGEAAAIVTNPIAKHVLYDAGFRHPGHTEFLASLAAREGAGAVHPVMMLWSERMAVVPVTVHIPLHAVPATLTTELIVRTGRVVARDLRSRFGIHEPRLALAGLNPHAGEHGSLGYEDDAVIAPAVAILRREGIAAEGPLPADTMFHERARSCYDVALAMYHDQALVPIKTIAFDEAVNVTLGLPFARTSPDHGTAFEIAGKGIARPDSLIAALRLAARIGAWSTAP